MAIETTLFAILASGAVLAAKGILQEIAKGTGKSAFEALKQRLTDKFGVKSLGMLEDAQANADYKTAIEGDLKKPEIAADPEILKLAEQLRSAIEQIPKETAVAYAVDIETIRSGRNILLEQIEGGIKSKIVEADKDVTISGVTATPAGKP